MTTGVRHAKAVDVFALTQLARDADAPCYVGEVAGWMVRDAWYWAVDPANDQAALLLAEDVDIDGAITYVRLAAHRWYLSALYVEPDRRRRGIALDLLTAAVVEIRTFDPDAVITLGDPSRQRRRRRAVEGDRRRCRRHDGGRVLRRRRRLRALAAGAVHPSVLLCHR